MEAILIQQRMQMELMKAFNINIIIPDKRNFRNLRLYDKNLYKIRHRIENFFLKLKQYQGIATRFDKKREFFRSDSFNYICDLVELMKGSCENNLKLEIIVRRIDMESKELMIILKDLESLILDMRKVFRDYLGCELCFSSQE